MIDLASRCPKCGAFLRQPIDDQRASIACPACAVEIQLAACPTPSGRLPQCVVCPSHELFVRKDFPQRLGLTIVVAGFLASSVTWFFHQYVATYGILFGTALLDLGVYLFCGEVLECYACHAQYRGADLTTHGTFDLEVHERHRQRAARLSGNG